MENTITKEDDSWKDHVVVFLPLSQGKVTQVTWRDYDEKLRGVKWYAKNHNTTFYACRSGQRTFGKQATQILHRILVGAKRGELVDHISGDGLDNRRSNLRICTNSENCRNKRMRAGSATGVKGVKLTRYGRFQARIWWGNTSICLGTYPNAEAAARAHDYAAVRLYGVYARLNCPWPEMLAEGRVAA